MPQCRVSPPWSLQTNPPCILEVGLLYCNLFVQSYGIRLHRCVASTSTSYLLCDWVGVGVWFTLTRKFTQSCKASRWLKDLFRVDNCSNKSTKFVRRKSSAIIQCLMYQTFISERGTGLILLLLKRVHFLFYILANN